MTFAPPLVVQHPLASWQVAGVAMAAALAMVVATHLTKTPSSGSKTESRAAIGGSITPAQGTAPIAVASLLVVGTVPAAVVGDNDGLFSGSARLDLRHLGVTVTEISLRPGASADHGLARLRDALPGRVIAPAAAIVAAGRREAGWDAAQEFGPEATTCRGGLKVGMLDTGVDTQTDALRGQTVVQRWFVADGATRAPRGHGTAVASLLVGRDGDFHGLLPGSVLYSAAVLKRRADGTTSGELTALFEALDWMIGEDVQVANMSFETAQNDVLSVILETAARRGLVMTAAAGNGGRGSAPAYPAAHPSVLAATATDRSLNVYEHATTGAYIDFAAPGVGVLTADDAGVRPRSGTSFAVPFLTAAAALEVARGAPPTADGLRRVLRRHARDLGSPGKDDTYGWGMLDLKGLCG